MTRTFFQIPVIISLVLGGLIVIAAFAVAQARSSPVDEPAFESPNEMRLSQEEAEATSLSVAMAAGLENAEVVSIEAKTIGEIEAEHNSDGEGSLGFHGDHIMFTVLLKGEPFIFAPTGAPMNPEFEGEDLTVNGLVVFIDAQTGDVLGVGGQNL